MGLLCHLANYEEHIKTVCSSTTHLVLETAVCDSDDPNKSIEINEERNVYDLSYNGKGCRPSPSAIERVLTNCAMNFKRVDNIKFNSNKYEYDWFAKNDGSTSLHKRKIWFIVKDSSAVQFAKPEVKPIFMPPAKALIRKPLQITVSPKAPHLQKSADYTPKTVSPNTDQSTYIKSSVREDSEKFAVSLDKVPQYSNLKVLYLPLNVGAGVQKGTYDAFNNIGCNFQIFDFYQHWEHNKNKAGLQKDFLNKIKDFQPNLIHMQLQFTGLIELNTLIEARKICPDVIITNWTGDIRSKAGTDFISISKGIDYSLISSTGQLDLYSKSGCKNVRYWQIGYDPKNHYPINNDFFNYDAAFIGNNYGDIFPDGKLRLETVNTLKNNFLDRAGIFGSGWPAPNSNAIDAKHCNEIYNKTICPLSVSNFNSVSHYFSDRLLYCVASGRPTISWYFPGCEDYFIEGQEIFYAKTQQDIINAVNYCKNNPDEAKQIGVNGAAKVLKEHTFTSKILELLNITKLA